MIQPQLGGPCFALNQSPTFAMWGEIRERRRERLAAVAAGRRTHRRKALKVSRSRTIAHRLYTHHQPSKIEAATVRRCQRVANVTYYD
jgi:hypothetical protein